MSTLEASVQWLPVALALGVLLASLRLVLQARTAVAGQRPWRIAVLVLGQSLAALMLLHLLRTDDPKATVHTLHLLTARAPARPAPAERPGERWLRLPEAPAQPGAAPVPDLATALRQFPDVRELHVKGDGLLARDRVAVGAHRLAFAPAPLPFGLKDWWAPQWLRTGEPLHVTGTAHAPAGSRVTLLDPGGGRVDEQALQADGGFALQATPRSPGLAEYRLQLRGTDGASFEGSVVPVYIASPASAQVLLLAGGPDPDLKYLRRWAADHGARLQASIELGAGMRAGDPPFALDARTLANTDLLILDDRSWNALERSRRDAILSAVDAGMGLLLRASAPLANAQWLGLRVRTATLPATYRIPGAVSDSAVAPPPMQRPQLRIDNPDGPVLLRDDRGVPLASWRPHGRGRIGAWLPGDTFRLALEGHGALHARQLSSVLNALMRARSEVPPPMPLRIHSGQRTEFCALQGAPAVLAPGSGEPQPLVIDARSGERRCAAYWPREPGWHRLRDARGERAFLVRAQADDAVLRAAETQRATAELAGQPTPHAPVTTGTTGWPRWLLFLCWLALMGGVWWLERARAGRASRARPG